MNSTITDIRAKGPAIESAPVETVNSLLATNKIRPLFPERTLQAPRHRRSIENWLIVTMIACTCAFAGALAVYVVYPAVSALTAPRNSWTPEGP